MPNVLLDQTLCSRYVVFDCPADEIVRRPELAEQFCAIVRGSDGALSNLTDNEITSRLIQLRKRGQDRGGLPRIRK